MLTKIVSLRSSAAVAVATTEYGIYDAAKVSSTATTTTTNKLVDTAGNFVVNLIAVGDIIKNTTTGKFALVTAVDSATQLSVDSDVFLSTNTYAIYPNLGYKLQQAWKELVLTLDVTAAATEVGDTLDVYVDASFNGGGKFVNIGHFTQVLGNGGAKTFMMSLRGDNPGAAAVFSVGSDAAVGVTRQIGFGDRLRFRAVTVDSSTQNIGFTYSLTAALK